MDDFFGDSTPTSVMNQVDLELLDWPIQPRRVNPKILPKKPELLWRMTGAPFFFVFEDFLRKTGGQWWFIHKRIPLFRPRNGISPLNRPCFNQISMTKSRFPVKDLDLPTSCQSNVGILSSFGSGGLFPSSSSSWTTHLGMGIPPKRFTQDL